MFFKKIAGKQLDAKAGHFLRVKADLFSALSAVAAGDIGRDGVAISDDAIDQIFAHVVLDRTNVFAERVMRRFAGLRHEVGNVYARRFGTGDGVSDFGDQQIWKNAGIEGAGPHKDQVGIMDRFQHSGKGPDAPGHQFDFANGSRAARNVGFAANALAVGERRDKMDVGDGGRKNAASDGKHLSGDAHRLSEIASDMGERSKKEIAEIVAAQAASGLESILEEPTQKRFVFGEGDHTVADVAGRKNAVFAAEAA